MPNVAFEASPATGGESCRDLIGRVAQLAGLALDAGWARGARRRDRRPARLLAHPDPRPPARADGALGARRGRAPARRRAGARVRASASSAATSPSTATSRDGRAGVHPAAQRPALRAGAGAGRVDGPLRARSARSSPAPRSTMQTLALRQPRAARARAHRRRLPRAPSGPTAAPTPRPLVGSSLRAGITARILALFPDPQRDAPLRDALLQLAPGLIQCFAALDIWTLFADEAAARTTGGQPDSCWMWRVGGPMQKLREPVRR